MIIDKGHLHGSVVRCSKLCSQAARDALQSISVFTNVIPPRTGRDVHEYKFHARRQEFSNFSSITEGEKEQSASSDLENK